MISIIVICKKTIEDNLGINRLFTAGATYEFIEVNNKFSQRNGYVGYIKKMMKNISVG